MTSSHPPIKPSALRTTLQPERYHTRAHVERGSERVAVYELAPTVPGDIIGRTVMVETGPEPFGLVMIETMACGTPVLAFRQGSVSEIIDQGVTGAIVDTMDEAVRMLPRVIELDRHAVRRRFEQRFSSILMAKDYVALPKIRVAKHCRDYNHADALYAFLEHGDRQTLVDLKAYLDRGREPGSSVPDTNAHVDLDTLTVIKLVEGIPNLYGSGINLTKSPPVYRGQARILCDDVQRLLAYNGWLAACSASLPRKSKHGHTWPPPRARVRAAGSHPHLAVSLAARPEKREYLRQFGSHPGNPG
jgi:Glycosyl transferases group 1